MPSLNADQINILAANHLKRSSGEAWANAGAPLQATATAEVTAILEDAAALVTPKIVPLPPTLSPAQAWHKRHEKTPTVPPAATKASK